MTALADQHCAPCEGGAPLADTQIAPLLASLTDWQRSGSVISREFKFKDHYQAQAFTNAVMWVSHREDHHPQLGVGYNTVRVDYSTHSVGGLSQNDFICAAKLDRLFAQ